MRKARRIFETKIPNQTLAEAKRITPRDGGNARRNTKLKKKASGPSFSIESDYKYATVIDQGLYGKPPGSANGPKTRRGFSTQAPDGIFVPLEKFVRKLVRKYFRRF